MAMWLTTAVWFGSRMSLVSCDGEIRPLLHGVPVGDPGCESTMKAPSTLMRTAPGCMMVLSISSAEMTSPCVPSSGCETATAPTVLPPGDTTASTESTIASSGTGVVVGGMVGGAAHSLRQGTVVLVARVRVEG